MKDDLTLIVGAVRYIEAHLKDKLTLDQIASEAGFSKYYFTRLFSGYTGQSPFDYYRGRKLTEAIRFIQRTGCKIIDAAYEYGYSSPEVFARACATVFGKPPSAIRSEVEMGVFRGVEAISEGYLWFVSSYNRQPGFRVMEGLELSGIGFFTDHRNDTLYNMTPEQLKSAGHNRNGQTFKVTWLEKQAMGYLNFIGKDLGAIPKNEMLLTKTLPKMAYVVFDFCVEKEAVPYLYQYIYNDWFTNCDFEPLMPMHMEVMEGSGQGKTSSLLIPVIPKTGE